MAGPANVWQRAGHRDLKSELVAAGIMIAPASRGAEHRIEFLDAEIGQIAA